MRTLLVILAGLLATTGAGAAAPPDGRGDRPPPGAIAFSSLAPRGWDVYLTEVSTGRTRRLTDHPALDYNASFSPDGKRVAFVSERDGNLELYTVQADGRGLRRLTHEFALDDHPAWSPDGKRLAFVSTRRPARKVGQAWNGIYVMNADGSGVRRLSGEAADYSPAWSPKRDLLAFASGSGQTGGTDLFVMKPDGSGRRLVVKNGGWPAFGPGGETLYFHSLRQGRWGIWRVKLDGTGLERVTPADVEAFTPRTSADGKVLVAAVRKDGHRQAALIDPKGGKITMVTKGDADHWNPSVSPDGRFVVYHQVTPGQPVPNVELWGSPPGFRARLARLAGAFPAFAPGGKRLALTGGSFARLDVMNLDGTGRKAIYSGKDRALFSLSWAHTGERIAFSLGGVFQGPEGEVDVATVRPDGTGFKRLTYEKGNNGFPSFSPDGKRIVFRSGRGGSKNLYVMNADGTKVRRLTKGKWTDTMCDWSPAGDRIVFASDRGGDFEVYLIRPDGTGLRKLVSGGGRNNHPHFSPDGRWVVFTSKRAGFSAEEISLPRQPQPYGDLFAVRVDGSGLTRLTHNGFEEGTPAWGPAVPPKLTGEGSKAGAGDY
jgi:Tol biopolymer transport system component